MATVKISLKFGEPTLATSIISFQAQLRKQQIENHNKGMSQKLKKYNLPFVVMEMPETAKSLPLPKMVQQILGDKYFQESSIQANGLFYRIYSHKHPLMVGVISKIQKAFKELTHLQNKLSLNIRLHNVDDFQKQIKEKEYDFFTLLFDKASIEAQVDLDGKFIETIGLLFNKISPGFSESPIIAALQIFSELSLDLQLYPPTDLSKKARIKYTEQIIQMEQPDDEQYKQLIKSLIQIKEPTTIYVHFKSLGFIKIQFETRFLGYLHYFTEIGDFVSS